MKNNLRQVGYLQRLLFSSLSQISKTTTFHFAILLNLFCV